MQPTKIIIKTLYSNLNNEFCKILKNYPKIKFFNKKINGEFITVIKCSNYYNSYNINNIYGSYVYLYTSISLIISELIIKFFEKSIVNRLLNNFNFSNSESLKIKNISFMILDPNYPSINSKKLYLYKKDLILNKLLLNFRNKNYLTIEGFTNFSLENYFFFLNDVIEKSACIYFTHSDHIDLINFILNNLLK